METNEFMAAARELEALRHYVTESRAALARLEERLSPTQEFQQTRESSEGSVEVLVRRTPGPRPTIYHRASDPCGRVTGEGRSLDSFNPMSASRAQSKGLSPCTACWPSLADRAALQALEA